MNTEVLYGISKKTRNAFNRGEISEKKVMDEYSRNKKEADSFSFFGLTVFDLIRAQNHCSNPVLRKRIEMKIEECNMKSRRSNEQNKINLQKLEDFKKGALGIGLRKVVSTMKRMSKKSTDKNMKAITLLLETEYANLSAKKHGRSLKQLIYERKQILLERLSYMLKDSGWRYGYNEEPGKNASYIIYFYLPNGEQLSWHTNDYMTYRMFPYIDSKWDGKPCSTLEKILSYIGDEYGCYLNKAA